MIEFIVNKSEDSKKLDRVLLSKYSVNRNTVFKALRNKDIKINGKRISENVVLNTGDNVIAYITADIEKKSNDAYKIIYCDDEKLVISKKQGISVDNDEYEDETVISALRSEYGNECMLCHRLDRNTGGLLLVARNTQVRDNLVRMLENKEITKKYMCIVYGRIIPSSEYIIEKAWHFKDKSKSIVYISDVKRKYYKEIITRYKLIQYNEENNTSLLEVIIDTGRTHQIRAHMAHIGYPIIGDGKYGTNQTNNKFKYKYQALWATEIVFNNGLVIKDEPLFI